jgi:dUTP pyrophosphatase
MGEMTVVLTRDDLLRMLRAKPPLVEGYLNLQEQLQPNGFDLTLQNVANFQTAGLIAVSNAQRKISQIEPLEFDSAGGIFLKPGPYLITFNEIVHLPRNVMALGAPRSSLLRCGVTVHMAVWDAGYSGRSQSLLVVFNDQGFRLEKDARVAQLVFQQMASATPGYNGIYQGENLV